jgi:hypothetical protein
MGLLDRIRRGEYVPDSTPGRTVRGGTTMSLAEAAGRITDGEETLAVARDFLDQVGLVSDGELAALIRERPALTGSREVDALLAGVAEHLAAVRGLPCSAWVHEPERFLDRFWFVSSVPGFRATALAQTPMALKRRGILWPARSLERV